jgi:MOSC domain-containing protein YiiM
MGKVIGIAARKNAGEEMVVYASVNVTFEKGVGDEQRGKDKADRQVTIMTLENWNDTCADLGRKLHWATRRANILIEGIDLANTTGQHLKIGNFFLEITGELAPCYKMDEEFKGLAKALTPNWRGGVTCKILSEGALNEGDQVVIGEIS